MTLGGCKTQIGICHGYNTFLNALEYHNCSEINVAATPLVLLLATRWDMEDGDLDASKVKAFNTSSFDFTFKRLPLLS